MVPGRRAFLSMAQAAGLAAVLPRAAHAQAQATFPSKPVHLIVPYAPGGSADVLSRIVAQHLSQQWGQPVIVETKPGGGTIIGSSLVAKAPADGYTILFISNSFVINAKLRGDLPYDGIKAFVPVANMVNSPQVVAVNAASPYQTFKDWVAAAKARPGAVSIGTLGPATTQHIAAAMLQRATGTELIYTAFTGGAPAVNAALGGHIDTVLANLSELSAQIEAGKLRALAVTTRERLDTLRQVPTVAELGYPGYEAVAWFGFAAPVGTPQAVVNKFAEGLRAALADPAIRQRVITFGLQPAYLDPKEFATHIGEQYEKYSRVIDEAKIKAE
jgi:tripartite-type tricarboxylate transporter receptor subunit TctC